MSIFDNLEVLELEELLYLSTLAEAAERYDDMLLYFSVYVQQKSQDLSPQERCMLSTVRKEAICARLAACRTLSATINKEERSGNLKQSTQAECYWTLVQQELCQLCKKLLHLIDSRLLVHSQSIESRVFYRKMKSDLLNTISEVALGSIKEENIQLALVSYQDAYNEAINGFPPTHPLRLGTILSFSVFLTERMNNWPKAARIRKEGFDVALMDIETVPNESYQEVTFLMQLLRDSSPI